MGIHFQITAGYTKLVTYLKVGYLLHLITLFELVFLWLLFYVYHIGEWMLEGNIIVRFFILLPLLWSPLFPQLDARSRFQNYKLIRDRLYLHGFRPGILKPFIKSRCQRDAALAAAEELGMGKQCRGYFRNRGYRWYHLFPDFIFERPMILCTANFWVITFFAKTYHCEIDFAKLKADTAGEMQLNWKNKPVIREMTMNF